MNYTAAVTETVAVADTLLPFTGDVAFISSPPVIARSIFTDRGPVTKPAVEVQSGTSGSIVSSMVVTLPGGVFTTAFVGLKLRLTGSIRNSGEYVILGVPSSSQLKVAANLILPDPDNQAIMWAVISPRDGVIADSPVDVRVTINGSSVIPESVIGLLGQIVLPSTPGPTDNVKVSYSWADNPTVEFRRLNSPEFTLNGGFPRINSHTQHSYRYSSVLIRPSSYIASVPPQAGSSPLFSSATQVTLPGASLNSTHVGLYLRVTGLGARTYKITSVLSPTVCIVSPT